MSALKLKVHTHETALQMNAMSDKDNSNTITSEGSNNTWKESTLAVHATEGKVQTHIFSSNHYFHTVNKNNHASQAITPFPKHC